MPRELRSAKTSVALTRQEKRMLKQIAKATDQSQSDWIRAMIRREHKAMRLD